MPIECVPSECRNPIHRITFHVRTKHRIQFRSRFRSRRGTFGLCRQPRTWSSFSTLVRYKRETMRAPFALCGVAFRCHRCSSPCRRRYGKPLQGQSADSVRWVRSFRALHWGHDYVHPRLAARHVLYDGKRWTLLTDHARPAHNLNGTDTSGRHYEGVRITREHDSSSFVNGKAVTTFVNNFYVIGKAGAPSYKTHETLHVTVTPSGHITATHDRLRITRR
jgi:hypothetical protein